MVYECEECGSALSAGVVICMKCGNTFEEAVPQDAEMLKRGWQYRTEVNSSTSIATEPTSSEMPPIALAETLDTPYPNYILPDNSSRDDWQSKPQQINHFWLKLFSLVTPILLICGYFSWCGSVRLPIKDDGLSLLATLAVWIAMGIALILGSVIVRRVKQPWTGVISLLILLFGIGYRQHEDAIFDEMKPVVTHIGYQLEVENQSDFTMENTEVFLPAYMAIPAGDNPDIKVGNLKPGQIFKTTLNTDGSRVFYLHVKVQSDSPTGFQTRDYYLQH